MQLKFPFIYAEYEDGKKFKYDINEMIVYVNMKVHKSSNMKM